MTINKLNFSLLLLGFASSSFAQASYSSSLSNKYTKQQIVDPYYGIVRYNKLIASIGGDSIRKAKDGRPVQDWVEDYYVGGKLLHKGFYVDGTIKVFTNYHENGQIERNFTSTDLKHSKLEVFYDDGKPRSTINYFLGNAQKQYDFYQNGNPEYIEENDKNIEFLFKRNSYQENGSPISIFELTDKKKKTYIKKEYHENGKLKEEGTMIYRKDLADYQKDGVWTYFDEKGNNVKTETYHKGNLE